MFACFAEAMGFRGAFQSEVLFRKELKEKLDMFEEPQVLRILRRHLRSFISVEALEKACSEAVFSGKVFWITDSYAFDYYKH